MPTLRARPNNWFDAYEAMFCLWLNPRKPLFPKKMLADLEAHFLVAAQNTIGMEKVAIGPKEITKLYKANPDGVRLPDTMADMFDGIVAGMILYCVLRLAVHDQKRASVENAVKLVAFHQRKAGHPSSRASLMRAWGKCKNLSPYFAAVVYDPKAFKAIYSQMGLIIGTRALDQKQGLLRLKAQQLTKWMRDLQKLRADMKIVANEKIPAFFAIAERLRGLGEIHYAPGQKVRKKPLLDSKETWKLPRTFKTPNANIKLKRLTKAERAALTSQSESKR
jgi:hypothetical protein